MRIAVATVPDPRCRPTTAERRRHLVRHAQSAARRHLIPLICSTVLLADQVTKAVRPAGSFAINTGAAALLPLDLGEALWKSPTFGATCDTLDAVILLIALTMARGLSSFRNRVASTAVVAGLASNLADRLGTASLFHQGLPRGSIDWIDVPMWPTARTNLADVVIGVGGLLLVPPFIQATGSVVRELAHGTRTARLVVVAASLLALSTWTHYWQANRQATIPHPPSYSEVETTCSTGYSRWVDDWATRPWVTQSAGAGSSPAAGPR